MSWWFAAADKSVFYFANFTGMYKVTVNGEKQFAAALSRNGELFEGLLNDKAASGNLIRTGNRRFHLLYNDTSYDIEVLKNNHAEKTMTLRVNSVRMTLQLRDRYDELLRQLGMDQGASRKVNDIKAPMPGMVLNILVGEGQEVKKGDALLVLEAMKMENILKSPCDGVIKRVAANKGTAVEKNQILIQF